MLRLLNAALRSAVVAALVVGTAATAAVPATAIAAPAQVPCSSDGSGRYTCTWYRAGDGQSAGAIVVANGARVGFLHKGANWIVCQQAGAPVHSPEGYENRWYGWTEADNGAWGWASAVDASGGDNDGSFANAPDCNGAHGAAPSVTGLWGTTPPAAAQSVAPSNPAPAPAAPQPDSPDYTAAINSGFGPLSRLQSRHIFNLGAVTGDDGVVVMRFFIPHQTAAGKSLYGDNRSFDSTPDLSQKSRAWIVWNVGTGDVSLTIAPSTVGPLASAFRLGVFDGARISALRLEAKSSAADVVGTEDTSLRFSNDAFAERTSNNGLHFKMSLLNSLTNKVPFAAWSVDFDGRIDPINDTTQAAFTHYAAHRSTGTIARTRRLSRREAARSRATLRCLSGARRARDCKSLAKALRRAGARAVPPGTAATATATAARHVVRARAADAPQAAPAGAGGYAISLLGNGYPAVEAYYYPRYVTGPHVLFERRVDPDKINSVASRTIDSGGGVGALDRYSWFNCTSRADGGSTCADAIPGAPNRRLGLDIAGLRVGWFAFVSPDSYTTNPGQNAQDN